MAGAVSIVAKNATIGRGRLQNRNGKFFHLST